MYSKVTQSKIENLSKEFGKSFEVKLAFSSNKLRQTFTYKDSYLSVLSSKIFYKLGFASCNAS